MTQHDAVFTVPFLIRFDDCWFTEFRQQERAEVVADVVSGTAIIIRLAADTTRGPVHLTEHFA